MAVLEINDWDDSVTSCLCGKKGERTEKDRCVEKNRKKTDISDLPHPQIPQHLCRATVRGCGEGWANHFSVQTRNESALIIEFVSESHVAELIQHQKVIE